MADFLTKNLTMAISVAEETTFNTQAPGTFQRFVTSARNFYVDSAEKFDDRGKIGLGQELPTRQTTGYLNPISLEIADELNSFIAPMLIRRSSGRDMEVADVAVAGGADAGAFTKSMKMAKSVTSLKGSSVIWALGGANYIWTGCVVDSWRAEQTRSDIPSFTATLVGTGRAVRDSAFIAAGANYSPYIAPTYMIGAETKIFYTPEGESTIYLADRDTNKQRVLGWGVTYNNANRTDDRRPGDKRQSTGDPLSGHYVDRITTGDREVTGDLTLTLDESLAELQHANSDKILTNFTVSTNSKYIRNPGNTANTTIQHGVDFVFPKCYLRAEDTADDAGLAAIRFTIFPVYDDSTETAMKVVVRNGVSGIII